ncbi:hypothetical protein FACS1894208_06780 [Clostridia bacterium]|nr:hypothetical protein FACS1894208_06780 [Clostridia bacterium]
MNNIFNTSFEVSLRVLLTLETSAREWLTAEWIAAADFITVYGKDFGLADDNLHGDNNYKYSELALRRELTKEALKSLVFQRLIDVESTPDGFVYALGINGGDFCADFESSYAEEYRESAQAVKAYMSGKSEREIWGFINRQSVTSIQRSGFNG